MSVCCDSHIRGQVTSELFGMNGIAVHAVTLTVNAATGSALISQSGSAGLGLPISKGSFKGTDRCPAEVRLRNLKPQELLSSGNRRRRQTCENMVGRA